MDFFSLKIIFCSCGPPICPAGSFFDLHQCSVILAMAEAPTSAVSQLARHEALRSAISEFESILHGDQSLEPRRMKDFPSADSILTFTAELDLSNRQRRGRSFASRLFVVLLSVRDFCNVVDTFVSSHPATAALVWGSVRLTMMVRDSSNLRVPTIPPKYE
jgi:hypothetical protein